MRQFFNVLGGILISLISCGYLIPTAIASGRRLRNEGSIFIVNLFLGWTLIGWIVALAWAVSGTAQKD